MDSEVSQAVLFPRRENLTRTKMMFLLTGLDESSSPNYEESKVLTAIVRQNCGEGIRTFRTGKE